MMQEFSLSYQNNEIKRRIENTFKYSYRHYETQYGIIYRRDSVLLRVDILKGLAAIIKAAKPLSYIDNLYITLTLRRGFIPYSGLLEIHMVKPIELIPTNYMVTQRKSINVLKNIIFLRHDLYLSSRNHWGFVNIIRNNDNNLERYDTIINVYRDKSNLLSRFDNLSKLKRYKHLKIYDKLYIAHLDYHFERYKNYYAHNYHNNATNVYETIMGRYINYLSLNIMEWKNVFYDWKYRTNIISDFYNTIRSVHHIYSFKEYPVFKKSYVGFIYNLLQSIRFMPYINIQEQIYAITDRKMAGKYEYSSLYKKYANTNKFENLNVKNAFTLKAFEDDNDILKKPDAQAADFNFESTDIIPKTVQLVKDCIIKPWNDTGLYLFENFNAKSHHNYIARINDTILGKYNLGKNVFTIKDGLYSQDDKNIFVREYNYFGLDHGKIIQLRENDIFGNLNYKISFIVETSTLAETSWSKQVYISEEQINAKKNIFNIYYTNDNFGSKGYNNLYSLNNSIFVNKDSLYIKLYNKLLFSWKDNNKISVNANIFINKYSKKIALYNDGKYESLESHWKNLDIYKYLYVNKYKRDVSLYSEKQVFINETNHNIGLYIQEMIHREYKIIETFIDETFLNASCKEINVYNRGIEQFINKLSFIPYYSTEDIFINNVRKSIITQENDAFLIKELFEESLYSNSSNTIIFINKNVRDIVTNNIIKAIRKNKSGNVITRQSFMTKIQFNMQLYGENLLCDKLSEKASFIEYLNISAIKDRIRTRFYNDSIYICKDNKETMLLDNEFINKEEKMVSRSDSLSMHKKQKYLSKNKFNEFLHKNAVLFDRFQELEWFTYSRLAFFQQNLSIYKRNKESFKNTEEEWVTQQKQAFKEKGIEFLDILKIAQYASQPENLQKYQRHISKYDGSFVSKQILADYMPEVEELQKIISEVDIISDIKDFAWVYEEDDPYDDPFKIDELLLPENDSRYEDFEDIIFNKETGKPRSTVKVIDDYTFIAKYPIHYPIKDENNENAYENIAPKYLEVRTGIMKKVFLGYYKLWQDNIFDFSRMTIPQSAKKILDYLYAWILMSFAQEDIPEALRVFRMVRWYIERGIVECSEYQITYKPDDLTTGTLSKTLTDFPCSLSINDNLTPTMYIDTVLHVIRNNPAYMLQECGLNIYIENGRDTSISFYLNTESPTDIMLNDGILEHISLPFHGRLVYNIPYTGDTNIFTIRKLGVDNNDDKFFIGKIVIEGVGKNGELDIQFNPKLQGNKLLNNVSLKVLSVMNLYEDNSKLFESLANGNIHLDVVYDKMQKYWDLHHQHKDKGKRWMIKRT